MTNAEFSVCSVYMGSIYFVVTYPALPLFMVSYTSLFGSLCSVSYVLTLYYTLPQSGPPPYFEHGSTIVT